MFKAFCLIKEDFRPTHLEIKPTLKCFMLLVDLSNIFIGWLRGGSISQSEYSSHLKILGLNMWNFTRLIACGRFRSYQQLCSIRGARSPPKKPIFIGNVIASATKSVIVRTVYQQKINLGKTG